ncbi:hypothetical protein ACJX0J_038642, partial [Zea mays]
MYVALFYIDMISMYWKHNDRVLQKKKLLVNKRAVACNNHAAASGVQGACCNYILHEERILKNIISRVEVDWFSKHDIESFGKQIKIAAGYSMNSKKEVKIIISIIECLYSQSQFLLEDAHNQIQYPHVHSQTSLTCHNILDAV